MLSRMKDPEQKSEVGGRKLTGRGLVREVSYLRPDEAQALADRAKKERASKAEIIQRSRMNEGYALTACRAEF